MSAADDLTKKLLGLAKSLDEDEQALLTEILARSAVYGEMAANATGKQSRLRTGKLSLDKLIGASVSATAKTIDRHGIKLLNADKLTAPRNLGEVMECWVT